MSGSGGTYGVGAELKIPMRATIGAFGRIADYGRYRPPQLSAVDAPATMPAMPLFDEPVKAHLLWPLKAPWPRRRARGLMTRFQTCFPEVAYDWDLRVRIANGQAIVEGGRRLVYLYGGLVRHRRVTSAGLAVVLAHETGHHLGGPPFHPALRGLSSEDGATAWALSEGLRRVFGKQLAARIAIQGRRNLQSLGIA